MECGINIGFFAKNIGMAKAAEFASKAGFKYLDYTPPLLEDNWKSVMKENHEIFKAYGFVVNQTHAPYDRYGKYGSKHKLCMDRCMEATAYLGAKYVAVHGDEFDFEHMTYSPEAAQDYNHDYFEPYVAEAKKGGFKMAFETVFEDSPTRKRYTSNPEDLLKLILSFESDSAVCCWDSGHAHVSFPHTMADWIVKFGSLIQCTHIHDNSGSDSHQLPMTGDIIWEDTMNAFKKIGYNDIMSIEYAHGSMPECFVSDFLTLTNNVAEYLCKL